LGYDFSRFDHRRRLPIHRRETGDIIQGIRLMSSGGAGDGIQKQKTEFRSQNSSKQGLICSFPPR
jgi:hypothetical protein